MNSILLKITDSSVQAAKLMSSIKKTHTTIGQNIKSETIKVIDITYQGYHTK